MNLIKKQHIVKQLGVLLLFVATALSCKKDETFNDELIVNGDRIEVSSGGGTYVLDIVTTAAYEVSADVDWITIENNTGEKGKHKIALTVDRNDDDERTGTITIRSGNAEVREIIVAQESGAVNVVYVKENGTGDGRSWESATDLQTALTQATSASEIHIAAGTYRPTKTITNGDESDEADNTFEINRNIKLVGGYPADATASSTPDAEQNPTIFSGKLNSGTEVYHVMVVTAPKVDGMQVEIQGITIRDGNTTDRSTRITVNGIGYSRGNGGGMNIGGSKVVLRQVTVTENKATDRVGTQGFATGMFVHSEAELYMFDSHVTKNEGRGNGGGLWVDRSNAYIYNSTFNDNTTTGTAGAVHGYPDTDIYMYNSVISGNRNNAYGAGFYVRENSNGYLVNCLITDNISTSANGGGGVMLYNNTEVHLINTTVVGNEASGPGGGVYRRNNTNHLTVVNSIIAGNKQISSSSDIDVYEDGAVDPDIRSSAIGTAVYNAGGTVQSGETFNVSSMLNNQFLPIGANNPALTFGMSGAALVDLANEYTPALDNDLVTQDIHGNERGSKTIMGAVIE